MPTPEPKAWNDCPKCRGTGLAWGYVDGRPCKLCLAVCAAVAEAVAAEREACAKQAEHHDGDEFPAWTIAEEIRARSAAKGDA